MKTVASGLLVVFGMLLFVAGLRFAVKLASAANRLRLNGGDRRRWIPPPAIAR